MGPLGLKKGHFPLLLGWNLFFGHCGGTIEHISKETFRVPFSSQIKLICPYKLDGNLKTMTINGIYLKINFLIYFNMISG